MMPRPECRPAGILAWAMSVLLVASATLLIPRPATAAPMDYMVTSASCTGAGSITEAMDLANANPGIDTISFDAGLVVDAVGCPNQPTPETDFIVRATESVTIEGNGAKILGAVAWINPLGGNNAGIDCVTPQDVVVEISPGFIAVGEFGQDNTDVDVTISGLDLEGLSSVAFVNDKASLTIEDAEIQRIYSYWGECTLAAVTVRTDASFTANNTDWSDIWNDGDVFLGTIYQPAISGDNAGDLTIQNSHFRRVRESGVIAWNGAAGAVANIVTTRFDRAGGMAFSGATTANIVNSIWSDSIEEAVSGDPGWPDDRLVSQTTGDVNIIASTILYSGVQCGDLCQSSGQSKGWIYVEAGGSPINFIESAVGVNLPDDQQGEGDVTVPLLDSNALVTLPAFSADTETWIQPTDQQDAAALQTATDQTGLLTSSPGLPVNLVQADGLSPQSARATPLNPGLLINVIQDAGSGEANELTNPVDGTPITVDALGNNRVDAGGERNIGAVQLAVEPYLTVTGTGNETVDLHWTIPLVGSGTIITGYVVEHREKGTAAWTSETVGPDPQSRTVTGLTNGTEYEFQVVTLVDNNLGTTSNLVTATPLGPVQAPSVVATPSVCQTELSWSAPDAGGETIEHYTVSYRAVGDTDFTLATGFTTDLEFNVTGLSAQTDYEFSVRGITTTGTTGEAGTVLSTTTKSGDIDVSGTVTYNVDRPLFLAANGSSQGDANYVPNADLDCDGRVTPADYRLWYKAWIADGRVR